MKLNTAAKVAIVVALIGAAATIIAALVKPTGPSTNTDVRGTGNTTITGNYNTVYVGKDQKTSSPNNQVATASPTSPTTAAPLPAQADATLRLVRDGLSKARDDLIALPKGDLTCDTLASWQSRADGATRLAHAASINIHNPISQYMSACRNDAEALDAIRGSIVKLLDQGITQANR